MKREETVDYSIKIAWHIISRMYNDLGEQYDISASTGYVLLNIDVENGTPATKIAPQLGLETRSLTRILKTLEDKGWIYRKTDRKDKRFVKIFLTELGKEKREISRKTVRAFNFFIKENIPAEKLNTFFEVIQDITQLTDEYHQKINTIPQE
jgi:DNA-binding MarR family transcriptional regulator